MTSVFDMDRALERVDGDQELLDDLARIYLNESSELSIAISQAMQQNDIIAATKVAHTLKGASSNFCAQAIFDAAWHFEQLQPSNSPEEIGLAYGTLLQELERLSQAIRKEFGIRQ